ncbi:MAG: glycosyltransferase [Candidatus Krumholzibacteria bacterium]|nr:glycosyltransferase [Candidatus Krumholzibacteria bacterium]
MAEIQTGQQPSDRERPTDAACDGPPARCALIFINWNSADLVAAAARSAFARAAVPASMRVVVVDNGSRPESVADLRRALPQATIIELPENRGFAAAANAGLRTVSEPFALILNADIEFRNDAPRLLADALEARPNAALACPRLLRPDGSEQAAAVPEPTLFGELVSRSLARHLLRVSANEVSAVPGIVGPCMAVRRDRLERVGLLDEQFFFFFEETDWCRRIRNAGLEVLYVPTANVIHLQGVSANRRPIRARVQFYRARYQYFRKHRGRAAVAVLGFGLFLRLTLNLLFYTVYALLSGGRRAARDRVAVCAALWAWHALGCRPRWGFEP